MRDFVPRKRQLLCNSLVMTFPLVRSVFQNLAIALPANLLVFWLLLRGNTSAVLLFGGIGALLGVLLLVALEKPLLPAKTQTSSPENTLRHQAPVHDFHNCSRSA